MGRDQHVAARDEGASARGFEGAALLLAERRQPRPPLGLLREEGLRQTNSLFVYFIISSIFVVVVSSSCFFLFFVCISFFCFSIVLVFFSPFSLCFSLSLILFFFLISLSFHFPPVLLIGNLYLSSSLSSLFSLLFPFPLCLNFPSPSSPLTCFLSPSSSSPSH